MPNYYVDDRAQPNGDHEVHRAGCVHLPYVEYKTSLGYFPGCREAVQRAKRYYTTSNGCEVCSPECHQSG